MAEQQQNLGKSVEMPASEELLKKLPEGTLGLMPETDAFYKRFVESIAGSRKVGAGLNMAWELAGYDTLRTYPAFLRGVINSTFDRVVDAISPDPEVAEQAKKFRAKVIEEAERQRKAAEPTAEALGPADSLTDLNRYSQVRRIADVVFEHVSSDWDSDFSVTHMEDRRNEGVNPYYKQTHRGIFLEGYYGQLSKLWTPWGDYGFGGSGSGNWKEITPVILEKLGAVERVPQRNTEQGSIGPIYSVHRVDGIALPNPIERPRSQFVPYEEVNQAWNSLTQQYNRQQRTGR